MSDCHDAYLGNVRCDCGETINPGSPYVEVQPGGVLWHGNAQGGGHASNFESKRAPRTPDFRDLLRRDLLRYCKGRGGCRHQRPSNVLQSFWSS